MPLLSRMMRTLTVTGEVDPLDRALAGRQGGRWAEQQARAAVTPRPRPPDPATSLATLDELHSSGALTDEEFEHLRSRVAS